MKKYKKVMKSKSGVFLMREGMGFLGGGSDRCERVILEVVGRGLGGNGERQYCALPHRCVLHSHTDTR